MNKKILICSIIAVVILILVSFTGVVGYQTTKSSTIARASPLFTVRSSRAIDEDSKDFTCDYVGKGEEAELHIPMRNNRLVLLDKINDRISKMDVEEFNHFKKLIIDKLHNNNVIKEMVKTGEIREQVLTGVPIRTICDLTTDFPILCFLDNLYGYILFFIIQPIIYIIGIPLFLLFLLVYILVNGDLPPTILQYPPTIECCQPQILLAKNKLAVIILRS